MSAIIWFITRLAGATVIVALFFVVTQTVQIFPGVIPGFFRPAERKDGLPEGVEGKFLTTPDGKSIEVWHLRPKADQQKSPDFPVAVLFHGNAEDIETSFDLQRWLQSLGIASFNFDYRGYGRSSGWPSNHGLKVDTKAVLDHAASIYDLKKHRLILLGSSIGSGLAAYAAKEIVKPHTLLFFSPYTTLKNLVSEMPVVGYLAPFLWYDLETVESIKALKDVCLVTAHGTADTTIPPHHSRELMEAAAHLPVKKLIEVDGAGHNDLIAYGLKEIEEALLSCLALP